MEETPQIKERLMMPDSSEGIALTQSTDPVHLRGLGLRPSLIKYKPPRMATHNLLLGLFLQAKGGHVPYPFLPIDRGEELHGLVM